MVGSTSKTRLRHPLGGGRVPLIRCEGQFKLRLQSSVLTSGSTLSAPFGHPLYSVARARGAGESFDLPPARPSRLWRPCGRVCAGAPGSRPALPPGSMRRPPLARKPVALRRENTAVPSEILDRENPRGGGFPRGEYIDRDAAT